MRNKFFVFSMFSLFIIGLLLVILIGTTSQIVQAQYTRYKEINYYEDSSKTEPAVAYWIKNCDGSIDSDGIPTQFKLTRSGSC